MHSIYGWVQVDYSQIVIEGEPSFGMPDTSGPLLAIAEDIVSIRATANGRLAGVRFTFCDSEPPIQNNGWERREDGDIDFSAPPYVLVLLTERGYGVSAELQDLKTPAGSYRIRVYEKGVDEAGRRYLMQGVPTIEEQIAPPDSFLMQFEVELWARTT